MLKIVDRWSRAAAPALIFVPCGLIFALVVTLHPTATTTPPQNALLGVAALLVGGIRCPTTHRLPDPTTVAARDHFA